MSKLILVGLGGFLGAIARYGLSGFIQRCAGGVFPAGTLAVNLAGCLLIGALMCLVEERQWFTPEARVFLVSGFLGAFTTLSAVGYDTFAFLRAGDFGLAATNAAANLLLGLAAVGLGWSGVHAIAG